MPRHAGSDSLRRVTIRVRDLDTHALEEHTLERWVPSDDAGIREALVEAVEEFHPDARARARSYVGDAMSFLLPGKLVVAAAGETVAVRPPREDAPLFERDVA